MEEQRWMKLKQWSVRLLFLIVALALPLEIVALRTVGNPIQPSTCLALHPARRAMARSLELIPLSRSSSTTAQQPRSTTGCYCRRRNFTPRPRFDIRTPTLIGQTRPRWSRGYARSARGSFPVCRRRRSSLIGPSASSLSRISRMEPWYRFERWSWICEGSIAKI